MKLFRHLGCRLVAPRLAGALRASAIVVVLLGSLTPTVEAQVRYGRQPMTSGQPSDAPTAFLEDIGFDQNLGAQLPADLQFLDDHGATVRLGDYFGSKPTILVPVYYECPMLCSLVLGGLTSTLRTLSFDVGAEFNVVAFSIDPDETPEQAAKTKTMYVDRYNREGSASGWHFLSGDEASIRTLAEAIGFRYSYRPEQDDYAHAGGLVVVTPEGQATRYFYGVEFPPRDLRLALIEATDNQIGTAVDQVLLYCFQYDPSMGRYSAVVMNIVRLAGLLTLAAMGLYFLLAWLRHRPMRKVKHV